MPDVFELSNKSVSSVRVFLSACRSWILFLSKSTDLDASILVNFGITLGFVSKISDENPSKAVNGYSMF